IEEHVSGREVAVEEYRTATAPRARGGPAGEGVVEPGPGLRSQPGIEVPRGAPAKIGRDRLGREGLETAASPGIRRDPVQRAEEGGQLHRGARPGRGREG